MANGIPARVFMSGRSQHVTIPKQFRFNRPIVLVRRDDATGGLLMVERPQLDDVFAALDAAHLPHDFLEADRDRRPPAPRPAVEEIFEERS